MEQPAASHILQIAIDGPVGSGKSDISERLARALGLTYLNTGAMYRAFALACVRAGVGWKDTPRALVLLRDTGIELTKPDEDSTRPFRILLNGEDVTEKLFTPEMDSGSSDVGTVQAVREHMVERQQELAAGKSVVMEGRDIALRVLPHAQFKIYLTAAIEERAKRRFLQFQKKGMEKSFAEVLEDTKTRDIQDTTRPNDPLTVLADHWVLDTTGLPQEEVVRKIKDELVRRNLI